MPILGITASQNYPRITNSYESIATVLVGSGGSSFVEFTSIPSTYKHLQVRMLTRGSISATGTNVNVQFNSDTGNNYITHWLDGDGSTALGENSGTSTPLIYLGYGAGANASADVFGSSVWDILDYASTNKTTTCRSLCGFDNNGSGFAALISGLWTSTAAVTSLKISPNSGTFSQHSSFALYGIKGA
jgi:hypothetical protein